MSGTRRNHISIPTTVSRRWETYLESSKMYASGFDSSESGVEWVRFENESPRPDPVKKVPQFAFVVDDLEAVIAGKEVLISPMSPSSGVTGAFIVDNDAPVEFRQFDSPEYGVWPGSAAM